MMVKVQRLFLRYHLVLLLAADLMPSRVLLKGSLDYCLLGLHATSIGGLFMLNFNSLYSNFGLGGKGGCWGLRHLFFISIIIIY